MSRRAVTGAPAETGISMAELIVAMMIFGVVSTMFVGFFISTTLVTQTTQALVTNSKQASNGMNEISRVIRAGTANPIEGEQEGDPAFVLAKPTEVIVYAYINLTNTEQKPIMVRIYVDAQQRLVEQQWKAIPAGTGYWKFPAVTASPASTRILASTVATPTAARPLFTFLEADGTSMTVPTAGLDSDKRSAVAAVKVVLDIQGSAIDTNSRVTLTNTVGIPNLGISRAVT